MDRKLKQYHICVDPALDIFKLVLENISQYPPHLFFDQQFRRTAEELKRQYEASTEGEKITNWEAISYHLKALIREHLPETREMCMVLIHGGFKSKFSCQLEVSPPETFNFMKLINRNIQALVSIHNFDTHWMNLLKVINLKLDLFSGCVLVLHMPHRSVRMIELIYHFQAWTRYISPITFLFWADIKLNGSLATSELIEFSFLVRNIMYSNPRTIELSVDVFKVTKSHQCQATCLSELRANYVRHLLEPVIIHRKFKGDIEIQGDDLEIIREGLTFLFSFFMDPPNEESEVTKLILTEVDAVISEVPSIMCSPQTDKLRNLLHKIDGVKAKVRESYGLTHISSQFNSPRTNTVGFLDSLLETLQKMLQGGIHFIPLVEGQVVVIHEELASLRPFIPHYDFELHDKVDKRLTDTHTQIVNVIHFAAFVSKFCSNMSSSIWYAILCLPDVINHIKLVKHEVEKIKDDHMYINQTLTSEVDVASTDALSPRAITSKHEGAFVGFRGYVETILDDLQRGRKDLTIISISGMPGQGKTTLARKIYDDPSIQSYFHKLAWCSVSKECKIKKLLVNLLQSDNDGRDHDNQEIHDLADCIRKSLKGRKYFFVLDDIWDVDVWWQVQGSFPDYRNGSRILFTSRNHNLASQCELNSISHQLPLFSDDESWELMKEKLSGDRLPKKLIKEGKRIAGYCRGLPLAVVLVASHLKRIGHELDLWMEVAENLASEGCMHILELSYKYLPQHLKPCCLYFGAAFRRGEIINAGKLIRLWIAEGFMKENETRCSKILGREYLDYLISQNLVQVVRRGSMGNIKSCKVHDLLYDLCIQKASGDNFLHLVDYRTIQDVFQLGSPKYNFQCHWLSMHGSDPAFTHLTCNSIQKEVLSRSRVHSMFWFHDDSLPVQGKSLSSFFSNFRVLTVLDMLDVNIKGSKYSKVLFLLFNINLRYLGLRGLFPYIMRSIPYLWNLETLVLVSKTVLELPKYLWEIKSLRYVDIEKSCLNFDDYLPSVPSVAAASNIESLKRIILGSDVNTHDFLRSLPKLKELKCYFDQCDPEFLLMFGYLKHLEILTIRSVEGPYQQKGLVIPEGLLFRDDAFPLPDTIKKLTLCSLRLPWKAMSTIGKLSQLQVLKLCCNAFKGPTWDIGDGEFSKLKYLQLFRLDIERIDALGCDNSPFPCLEELYIATCDKLEEIPGDIYTLNTIYLFASPKAVDSVEAICEKQRYMGNQDLHLIVRDIPPIVLDD